jgi:hypothetical protein
VNSCDRRKNPYDALNAGMKTIFKRNLLHLLSRGSRRYLYDGFKGILVSR